MKKVQINLINLVYDLWIEAAQNGILIFIEPFPTVNVNCELTSIYNYLCTTSAIQNPFTSIYTCLLIFKRPLPIFVLKFSEKA